MSIISELLEK